MRKLIAIPKDKNWKLKAGHYKAKVTDVTYQKAKRSDDENCCINFEVEVPGKEQYEWCARAVFASDFTRGSQLRTFLEGLLGGTFFTERAGQVLDLDAALKNIECEIDLTHGPHDEKKYDWPMVLVDSARPVSIIRLTTEQSN